MQLVRPAVSSQSRTYPWLVSSFSLIVHSEFSIFRLLLLVLFSSFLLLPFTFQRYSITLSLIFQRLLLVVLSSTSQLLLLVPISISQQLQLRQFKLRFYASLCQLNLLVFLLVSAIQNQECYYYVCNQVHLIHRQELVFLPQRKLHLFQSLIFRPLIKRTDELWNFLNLRQSHPIFILWNKF